MGKFTQGNIDASRVEIEKIKDGSWHVRVFAPFGYCEFPILGSTKAARRANAHAHLKADCDYQKGRVDLSTKPELL